METIYNNSANNSGIYKIYNKLNGRIYIGSAKLFKVRFNQHTRSLRSNKHQNKFLQNDFNKCGEENFIFEVLEVTTTDKEKRRSTEQKYINQYFDNGKNCYNLTKNTKGNGPWNDPMSVKEKISKAQKQAWQNKSPEEKQKQIDRLNNELKKFRNDPDLNKKVIEKSVQNYKQTCLEKYGVEFYSQTEEFKTHIRESHKSNEKLKPTQFKKGHETWIKGKKMPPIPEETRKKMSEAQLGEKHHRFGKHLSEETKRKISETKKRNRTAKIL